MPPDPPATDLVADIVAELARHTRQSVLGQNAYYATCSCGEWRAEQPGNYLSQWTRHRDDAILSSGVLVDAADVRARTLEDAAVSPQWAEEVRNDGEYEYTSTATCAGEHLSNYRRRPALAAKVGPWEVVDSIPEDARWPDEVRDRAVSERDRGTTS